MMLATNLPTRRFTRDEFNAMPLPYTENGGLWNYPPLGLSRRPDRQGRAVVIHLYRDAYNNTERAEYLRPIIRVPSR